MKTRISVMTIMAVLLAVVSTDVLAQRQGGQQNRGGQAMRQQQVQRDRAFDRDRMAQRSQQVERGQKAGESRGNQDPLRERDRDQLRDQDRTHQPETVDGEPLYGNEIMTDEERSRYRERLQLAATDEEKARLKAEHQQMMQTRAGQLGVDLPPSAESDPAVLKAREQNRYRKEIGNPDEGEAIRKRSEEQVQPRLDDPGPGPDMDPEPE
ncbi:MAG: hypothetical protein PVG91_11300 [Gammaproteobacteria bacterium]|jgi:hypothetical protein